MNNYTNFQTKRANFWLMFNDSMYYSLLIFSITFLLSFVLLNYNFLNIKINATINIKIDKINGYLKSILL